MTASTTAQSSADSTARPSLYAFANEWEGARERLRLVEEVFDPHTTRRLDMIGVAPGWSCLEAGAGAGSITRWLGERVTPGGRVVAIDLDIRFLDNIGSPLVEVWQADVVNDPLPDAAFDLVHARLLLMHLPEREALLAKLVAALRPGGWLVVEEADLYPVTATGEGAYRAAWEAVIEVLAGAGMASFWARRLPGLLASEGLADVSGETAMPIFPGASPMARLCAMSWDHAKDQIGLPASEQDTVARAQAELADPIRWFPSPAVVAAWGRRPG